MVKSRVSVVIAVIVIVGSVTAVILQVRQWPAGPVVVETDITAGIGAALVGQACQATGGQGTVVILSSEGINPLEYQPEALEVACQKALAQCPGLRVVETVRVQFPTDDLREPVVAAYRDVAARYFHVGAVISLVGLPSLPASELQPWANGPALLVLSERSRALTELIRAGIVRAAVVLRDAPANDAPESFDKYYEVLTFNR